MAQNFAPKAESQKKAPASAGAFALFGKLLRSPTLLAALGVLLALGYGGALLHPAVNMDDLAIDIYERGGEFLRQSRITVWLLQKLTGIMQYQPFWPELFAAVCLVLAGLLFAAVLYSVLGERPAVPAVLVLCGGMLVWPYHAEVLIYSNQCGIGLGYLLCAAALAGATKYVLYGGRKHLSGALGAVVCLAFVLGLYESFAPVWFTMLAALLLCSALTREPGTMSGKISILRLLRGVWPLGAALVLRAALTKLLCALAGVSGGNGTAAKTIFWFSRASVRDALLIPLREWLNNYVARAFGVPALALLALACLALLVWAVRIRCRNGKALWVAMLLLSQFSLGLLQGTGSQMARATQCFAVFVPFVLWLLVRKHLSVRPSKKRAATAARGPADGKMPTAKALGSGSGTTAASSPRRAAAAWVCTVLAVGVLALETWSLADTFAINRERWAFEESTLQSIGAQLAELRAQSGAELPVAFCGSISYPEQLTARYTIPAANPAYKAAWVFSTVLGGPTGTLYRCENPQTSVINWAQEAFGSHAQMYLLMRQTGTDCKECTAEQQAAADVAAQDMPDWPQAGSVAVQNGCAVVHLGQTEQG
jgi:hypothetical protein